MTAIATQGTGLRHVRKTITFTGGAGAGAQGSLTVFSLTGRVVIEEMYAFASTGLSGATALIQFDTAAVTPGSSLTATDLSTGTFWDERNATASDIAGNIVLAMLANQRSPITLRQDLLLTISNADVTGGVLVIDCWYRPITDDGALAGDDIDTELVAAIWAYATRILTALDEDSTTLDLDATIRAAVGLASANLDTQLDAIPTAAEINAEVVDALATDTYAEPSAVPAATSSLKDKIGYLFAKSRNKRTQTATTETIFRDDGSTTLGTSTKSDDGTTFTKGEDT